jgi:autotransporter-associated beta strand protein
VSPLPLSPTASFRNSRINSVNGTLTLSGTLNAGGTSATTFVSLGGVNSAGIGDFNLTGVLAGTGSIEKSGAGTLFLNPSSTSGFTGTVRVGGSATGQQSSVRVTQLTVAGTSIFGANTISGDDPSAIDMNGGVLEFRNEGNMDFNALASGKNVYLRANSTFYTGPAAGGQAINGLTTLGTFRVASNTTGTYNSRNGYGMTLQAWTQENSNNNTGIANNMGGTLTFTGDAWNNADGSARNLTFSGNGNTRIIGNITATGTAKQVIKQGTGELILNGVGGTFTGNTSIEAGAVRDRKSVV